jgi:hypothetical protein
MEDITTTTLTSIIATITVEDTAIIRETMTIEVKTTPGHTNVGTREKTRRPLLLNNNLTRMCLTLKSL